jgi:hypothetical protein
MTQEECRSLAVTPTPIRTNTSRTPPPTRRDTINWMLRMCGQGRCCGVGRGTHQLSSTISRCLSRSMPLHRVSLDSDLGPLSQGATRTTCAPPTRGSPRWVGVAPRRRARTDASVTVLALLQKSVAELAGDTTKAIGALAREIDSQGKSRRQVRVWFGPACKLKRGGRMHEGGCAGQAGAAAA